MPHTAIHLFVQDDVPAEAVEAAVAALARQFGTAPTPETLADPLPALPDGALVVTLIDDDRLARLWHQLADRDVVLLPLPWSGNPLTVAALGLEGTPSELLQQLEDGSLPLRQSLLLADGEPVLGSVRLGAPPALQERGRARLRAFFRSLLFLHLRPFTVTTAKGQRTELAALSIEAAEESWMYRHHTEVFDAEPSQGRVAALVLAPSSLLAVFRRLFLKRTARGLVHGVGYVRSRKLTIESNGGPVPCRIDGRSRAVETLELEIQDTACRVPVALPSLARAEDKENIRLDAVPTGSEAVAFFTRRSLPLLPIASEPQFAELFTQLRRNARPGAPFVVLMILSALLATIGLYQNSGPVIIGAMILAPLMAPIVSLAMGFVRFDQMLIREGSRTLLLGVLLALGLAALFAWSLPLAHLTDQIRARLNPTLLDLGVAIVSGIAAAYVHAREELARSLAGVAIAVALVPPLGVAGIGLGLGNGHLFAGAFLLFLTNLVGIVFAAGATFYLLGFASLRYARTAFFYKLLVLLAVTVPLAFSTRALVQENRLYRAFGDVANMTVNGVPVRFELLAVHPGEHGPVARVRLTLPHDAATRLDRDAAVRRLQERLQADIELQVEEHYRFSP